MRRLPLRCLCWALSLAQTCGDDIYLRPVSYLAAFLPAGHQAHAPASSLAILLVPGLPCSLFQASPSHIDSNSQGKGNTNDQERSESSQCPLPGARSCPRGLCHDGWQANSCASLAPPRISVGSLVLGRSQAGLSMRGPQDLDLPSVMLRGALSLGHTPGKETREGASLTGGLGPAPRGPSRQPVLPRSAARQPEHRDGAKPGVFFGPGRGSASVTRGRGHLSPRNELLSFPAWGGREGGEGS